LKVGQKETLPIQVFTNGEVRALIEANTAALGRLANVSTLTFVDESLAKATNARATARFEVRLVYEQKVDIEAETARSAKELEKLEAEYLRNGNQLANQGFLSKAPAKVVAGLRTRRVELESLIEKCRVRLAELDAQD
jgi:valyl-tRNA synthetase